MPLAVAAVVLSAAAAQAAVATEQTYERLRPSLFTIEVHSGADGSRSSLGSGYLVSRDGRIVTNYHVIGAYVDEPDRYLLRARGATGERPVRLLRFDVANDLALLQAEGPVGEPLRLADHEPSPGSPVVAFGNPEGLGLSLIEGIFNGNAEKGLIDRMLLSMPLNPGMSGGPILNGRGEVIGTNVSVMWLSNSLSFGVPVAKVKPLLEGASVALERRALEAELSRQLEALEAMTVERLLAAFEAVPDGDHVRLGTTRVRRLPALFDCWDDTDEYKDEGITKARYGCDLQFSPSIQNVGAVASIEVQIERFDSARSRYGFFGTLAGHALSHSEVYAIDPTNGVVSAPRCASERAWAGDEAFKLTTCTSAYVRLAGFGRFDLLATGLSEASGTTFLWLKMSGFKLESFETVARQALLGLQQGGP